MKNTVGNARRCHRSRQISSRFHPGNRPKVLIWQNFQPAYRDPGWKNRDLGNRASPPSHMNTSKKDSGGRRDLGNRASPSNRAHVKRPLDCWQYPRMLARAKETIASRGETGDKAGNEVPLVLKRGSPVGPFALPGLNWLKMKCLHSSYMFTYM